MDNEEEKHDISDYTIATKEEVQEKYGVLKAGKVEVIPIDTEKKKAIFLTIKDLSVSESLSLLERISTLDEDGNPVLMWGDYYQTCWNMLVVKSQPHLEWKDVKRYNQEFMEIIMKKLPSLKKLLKVELEEQTKKKSRRR